jgi:hypothetical protein
MECVEVFGGQECAQDFRDRLSLERGEEFLGGAGRALDHGGEQARLRAEVLEYHRLADADPGGDLGRFRALVAGFGEHGGGGRQDRLAALFGGQAGTAGHALIVVPLARRA